MKKIMMKYLMLNCKQATFLMGIKEEGKLTFIESSKLSLHSSMCRLCKTFEKQSAKIGKESKHVQADEKLPLLTKEKINKMLRDDLSDPFNK